MIYLKHPHFILCQPRIQSVTVGVGAEDLWLETSCPQPVEIGLDGFVVHAHAKRRSGKLATPSRPESNIMDRVIWSSLQYRRTAYGMMVGLPLREISATIVAGSTLRGIAMIDHVRDLMGHAEWANAV